MTNASKATLLQQCHKSAATLHHKELSENLDRLYGVILSEQQSTEGVLKEIAEEKAQSKLSCHEVAYSLLTLDTVLYQTHRDEILLEQVDRCLDASGPGVVLEAVWELLQKVIAQSSASTSSSRIQQEERNRRLPSSSLLACLRVLRRLLMLPDISANNQDDGIIHKEEKPRWSDGYSGPCTTRLGRVLEDYDFFPPHQTNPCPEANSPSQTLTQETASTLQKSINNDNNKNNSNQKLCHQLLLFPMQFTSAIHAYSLHSSDTDNNNCTRILSALPLWASRSHYPPALVKMSILSLLHERQNHNKEKQHTQKEVSFGQSTIATVMESFVQQLIHKCVTHNGAFEVALGFFDAWKFIVSQDSMLVEFCKLVHSLLVPISRTLTARTSGRSHGKGSSRGSIWKPNDQNQVKAKVKLMVAMLQHSLYHVHPSAQKGAYLTEKPDYVHRVIVPCLQASMEIQLGVLDALVLSRQGGGGGELQMGLDDVLLLLVRGKDNKKDKNKTRDAPKRGAQGKKTTDSNKDRKSPGNDKDKNQQEKNKNREGHNTLNVDAKEQVPPSSNLMIVHFAHLLAATTTDAQQNPQTQDVVSLKYLMPQLHRAVIHWHNPRFVHSMPFAVQYQLTGFVIIAMQLLQKAIDAQGNEMGGRLEILGKLLQTSAEQEHDKDDSSSSSDSDDFSSSSDEEEEGMYGINQDNLIPQIVAGISTRLESSIAEVRLQGMAAAHQLALLIDGNHEAGSKNDGGCTQGVRFEELDEALTQAVQRGQNEETGKKGVIEAGEPKKKKADKNNKKTRVGKNLSWANADPFEDYVTTTDEEEEDESSFSSDGTASDDDDSLKVGSQGIVNDSAIPDMPHKSEKRLTTMLSKHNNNISFHQDDNDDSSYSSSSSREEGDLIPLNPLLQDDETDLRETPKPLYLRQCLEDLRPSPTKNNNQDDHTAASRRHTALEQLPQLLRSTFSSRVHIYADVDLMVELTKEVLHMDNVFDHEKFALWRREALVALVVVRPLSQVVHCLVGEGFAYVLQPQQQQPQYEGGVNVTVATRIEVLEVLQQSAFELCGARFLVDLEKMRRNGMDHKSGEFRLLDLVTKHVSDKPHLAQAANACTTTVQTSNQENQSQQSDFDQRTRRWGRPKGSPLASWTNAFAPMAPLFFYTLMGGFLRTKDQVAIWGQECQSLAPRRTSVTNNRNEKMPSTLAPGSASRLLAQVFTSLTSFLSCAGTHAPSTPILARDLLALVWSFRRAQRAEVRRSVLVAVASVVWFVPSSEIPSILVAQGEGGHVLDWLRTVEVDDVDEECRRLGGEVFRYLVGVLNPLFCG